MSLVGFHRILIGTAILFCAMFATHQGAAFLDRGGLLPLLLAVGFGGAAAALSWYLVHLGRFLGRERP